MFHSNFTLKALSKFVTDVFLKLTSLFFRESKTRQLTPNGISFARKRFGINPYLAE